MHRRDGMVDLSEVRFQRTTQREEGPRGRRRRNGGGEEEMGGGEGGGSEGQGGEPERGQRRSREGC